MKAFLTRLHREGLADLGGAPTPAATQEALETFSPANQTSQIASTRSQTRKALMTAGWTREQADTLVPKGPTGRPKAQHENPLPGVSEKAAAVIATAIGLDEYDGPATVAIADPDLWDEDARTEAKAGLRSYYKAGTAQKAYKALITGLAAADAKVAAQEKERRTREEERIAPLMDLVRGPLAGLSAEERAALAARVTAYEAVE